MSYSVKEVYIEAIKVTGRHRRDLGDIQPLAKSIEDIGLIHPITITESGGLVAGQRRLEAFRLLGRQTIPARVVTDLMSAVERLKVERDENTERKPMTPEELVSLGRALEDLERPKAQARLEASRHKAGRARHGLPPDEQRSGLETGALPGETTEIVAEALGVSASTYKRAAAVVDAARDETVSPEDRAAAQVALDDMNTTGNVSGNYEKIRNRRDARLGGRQKPTIEDAKKQRRAITQAIATLGGLTYGLKQIEVIHPDITSGEAAQWVGDLSEARTALQVLINRLKERTNAQA